MITIKWKNTSYLILIPFRQPLSIFPYYLTSTFQKKKKCFLGMRLGCKVSMVSMDQFVGLQVVPLSSVWFFNPYPHYSVSSFPTYRLSLFQIFQRVNFLYYPDWGKLCKPMEDSVSKLWFIHQIWPATCFC